MISLPNVSLVCIDTRCHELMRRTMADAVSKVTFGEIIVFSDNPSLIAPPRAKQVLVHDWPTKIEWERFLWTEVIYHVPRGHHALFMEWDAGISNVNRWSDRFLNFDYIGAPWPWHHDGHNVGNGGLHMRSWNLMKMLALRQREFPCREPGDDTLCRSYRAHLENMGFIWADEVMARQFSYETGAVSSHFGFHSTSNWPVFLDRNELAIRVSLAKQNPYVTSVEKLSWAS